MTQAELIGLIQRVGLKVGGGILIGMYLEYTFPGLGKAIFSAPSVQGLVGVIVTAFGIWKSVQDKQLPPGSKPT